MKPKRQEVTREQLEDGRHRNYSVYGYKKSYCDLIDSCEECDRVVCFWCRVIKQIEEIQKKRILRICKQERI